MMTRFNPLALMLGLFAVLILGSAIFTMSAQRPPQEQVVSQDVFAELLRSLDGGVAEFLDLAHVKPNTLGNTRMLKRL